MTAGTMGASIIGAFDIVQYWLWFIAIIATLFGVGIVGLTTFWGGTQSSKFGKLGGLLGGFSGGLIGAILGAVVIASSYVQLWLSYYIIENTPIEATSWAELGQDSQMGLIGFAIILVISVIKDTLPKSTNNN